MPITAETCRVFFALWPGTGLATQIDKLMAESLKDCQGRKIRSQNLHITLAFIGSVNADTLDCLQQAAAKIRAEPFKLMFDHLGYWSRPRIVWLAATEVPEALVHLQTGLVQSLAANCAYQPETRPFHAHLSLMRKARRSPAAVDFSPIHWPVNRFSLIRSHTHPTGVEYEVLNHWPLRD